MFQKSVLRVIIMIQRFLYCDNACLTYIVGKAVVEQVNYTNHTVYRVEKKRFFASQRVPRSVYKYLIFHEK